MSSAAFRPAADLVLRALAVVATLMAFASSFVATTYMIYVSRDVGISRARRRPHRCAHLAGRGPARLVARHLCDAAGDDDRIRWRPC